MRSAYRENGLVVIRASAGGGCLRSLCATLAGLDPRPFDDRAEMRMAEGNLHEPDIIRRLGEEHGWHAMTDADVVASGLARGRRVSLDTDENGKTQVLVEFEILPGLVLVRGHIDGGVRGSGTLAPREERVVEAKAVGRDVFKKWLADGWDYFDRYAVQLSLYMIGLDLPGLFAVKNRDTGELDVTVLNEPPVPIEKLRAKAMQIVAGGHRHELPSCDREPDWMCPFRYLHEHDEEPAMVGEFDEEVRSELDALGVEWKTLRSAEDEASARRKEIAKRVRELVGDKATVRTEEFTVTSFRKPTSSYDMDELRVAAKEVGLDIDDYKRETWSKQVQFRAKKGA